MSKLQTLIKNKQSRYKQYGVKEVFKKEDGAIDLASIMVGVIVIGLIGGVIAATVFAVIPWSQDNAAKQQLDSIVQAENAYFGLSSANPSPLPAGTPANSFGKSADLQSANLLTNGPRYCVTTPADGKSYTGYSQSGSGAVFTVTDKNSKPEIFAVPAGSTVKDALPADCQFITVGMTTPAATPTPTPTATTPVPYVDPTPTKIIMTYQCDTTTTVQTPVGGSISNATGTYTWNDGSTSATTNSNSPKILTGGIKYTFIFDGTAGWVRADSGANFIAGSKCLRSVDHWGSATNTSSAQGAFQGATNLTDVPSHIPSTINHMQAMFYGATSFNDPDIKNWDVSKVQIMQSMFYGASSFNQDLSGWNTGAATDMSYMFNGAASMNGNLNGWNTGAVTNMDHMFYGASSFNQPLNNWNTTNVTNMLLMLYGAPYTQDLTSWNMNKVNKMAFMLNNPDSPQLARTTHPNMIRLTYQCDTTTAVQTPVGGSVGSATGIYTWNDGATTLSNTTKTLTGGTKYTFIFEGTSNWFRADNGANFIAGSKCLRSVDHWGSATVTVSAQGAFQGATNLTNVPANVPSTINHMQAMFYGAASFNDSNVKNWNVSNVQIMQSMFYGASSFNQDLSGWNTGAATDMSYMFNGATAMNGGLNGWNTLKVTNMDHMFYGASSFNQPLNNWNTANVTNMLLMFYGAPYTQDLTSWDMNKVTRMAFMLSNPDSPQLARTTHPSMIRLTYQCDTTTAVQTPVGGVVGSATGTYTWNDGATAISNTTKTLTGGTKYTFIFEGTSNWFVGNSGANFIAGAKCIRSMDHWGSATATTSAAGAFQGATNLTNVPANVPSTINNMQSMFFGATSFNDPNVKNWNVSNVQIMSYMFNGATAFNQDLSGWNTGAATDMSSMFAGATAFNQDIHTWNTTKVTKGTLFAPASFPDAYMPANTSK